MLQARAHLQSTSARALRRPAAVGCSSSSEPTVPTRTLALGRAQRRWEEPQVARLQWSIVQLPIVLGLVDPAGPRSWAESRRYTSTDQAKPPPRPQAPLASVLPSEVIGPPPRSLSSAPMTPPPPLAASYPPQRPQGAEQAKPLPPVFPVPTGTQGMPPSRSAAAALELSSLVDPNLPPIEDASEVDSLKTAVEARQPVALPSTSGDSGPRPGQRPAVHPASFFGPQRDRYPVRISAPPQLPPVVPLNSLILHAAMPWLNARQRFAKPTEGLTPLFPSSGYASLPRSPRGRWLSRESSSGRGREPRTLDGQRHQPAKQFGVAAARAEIASAAGFGLGRATNATSTATDLVNESMEVMSFPALPAPYLRPDAEPQPAGRSPAEQKLTGELSRRLTDHAIRVNCVAFRIEEALELFSHAYPGWLPWSPEPSRPGPAAADVDERVIYSLSDGLVKTGNATRAASFLEHARKLLGGKLSAAFYHARMRVEVGQKAFTAAQDLYKTLANCPGEPLNDRYFGPAVMQTLMRIGKLTDNPSLTLYWLKKAQTEHGIQPGFRELRELLDAFAKIRDAAAVASVWKVVQTLPVRTSAEHRLYTHMFDTCLRLYAASGSGASYAHVSFFVAQAIASGKLAPTPDTFATVMRVAAEEENYVAARDILRTMESGELNGQAFPAEAKHFEALLVALDRQLPHVRKAALATALEGDAAQQSLSIAESADARTRDDQAAEFVLERALELVLEMKQRDLPLSGSLLVRLTRMLSYRAKSRPEAIRLAMSLLASLPQPGEGWSARNIWAMIGGGADGFGGTTSASRVFSALIQTLSATREVDKYKTALKAFDHFLQLRGPDEFSVVDAARMLSLAGRANETQYIERLWELAIKRAIASREVVDPPEDDELPSDAEQSAPRLSELRPDGGTSFLDDLGISLPERPSTVPFVEHLGPAMEMLFQVVNRHLTPESLLYLEKEWLRVYQLGFGFDAACWCQLAQAYLGAGRYERGFQILNDVVLFRHNQLLADFERAHGGLTVPYAPSLASEQDGLTSLLSDEIQRAPPHYQDMVAKSYSPLASPEDSMARQKLIRSLTTCRHLYGRPQAPTGGRSPTEPLSIAIKQAALNRQTLMAVARAVSWAPGGILRSVEEAQRKIRAEALRQWHEDPPELNGENPLQRAERFFANYPRIAQVLAIREARDTKEEHAID